MVEKHLHGVGTAAHTSVSVGLLAGASVLELRYPYPNFIRWISQKNSPLDAAFYGKRNRSGG